MQEIKNKLEKEIKDIQAELSVYKSEDPLADPEQNASSTVDDAVTVTEGHDRVVATRLELKQRLNELENTVKKISEGSYGICDKCGEKISRERLEALPTARFCLKCDGAG